MIQTNLLRLNRKGDFRKNGGRTRKRKENNEAPPASGLLFSRAKGEGGMSLCAEFAIGSLIQTTKGTCPSKFERGGSEAYLEDPIFLI